MQSGSTIAAHRRRVPSAALALLAALAGTLALPLHAQQPATDPIEVSFAQAAARTLQQHAELRALALQLAAADTRRDQAALRPGLELGTELEGFGGTGALQGVDGAEFSLSLSSLFERGGKRAARIESADRARALLDVERRVAALDLLTETGRRFVALAAAQASVELARRALAQAQQTVELIAPRVRAARSPRTELLGAQLELEESTLALAADERELQTAQAELAAQWGEPSARPRAVLALLEVPKPPSFESLAARLEQLPDLQRYAAEADLRAAELRLARAQARADLRWSLGVRHYEGLGEQALVAGISLPLFGSQRNAAAEREAELSGRIVGERAGAARMQLRPLLLRQHNLLQTTRERVRSISEVALPKAREALEITERGYRIGRFPYRELALAQAQLLALEAARLEAATQHHLTSIEIERLTGAQLPLIPEVGP